MDIAANLNRRDENNNPIWVTNSKVPDCVDGCQLPDLRSRDWLLNLKPAGYAERFWDLGNVGTGFDHEYYWGGIYFFSMTNKVNNTTAFEIAKKGIYWPPPTQQINCPEPPNNEYVENLPPMPDLPSSVLP